jgi:hypothetical protein
LLLARLIDCKVFTDPIVSGIAPERLLRLKSRLVRLTRFPISVGRNPVILLPRKLRETSCRSRPISEGMVLESEAIDPALERSRLDKFDKRASSAGIVPERSFSPRSRLV